MMSFTWTGNRVNSPPAPTAIPIWVMKASDAPVTMDEERERVLITIVAIMVLSGNSNKNITAKMPKNAPTFMGTLELLTNHFGEGQSDSHLLHLLRGRRGVAAPHRVRVVEGFHLIGERGVVHVGGCPDGNACHVRGRDLFGRLIPVIGDVAPDGRTVRDVRQERR